LGFFKYFEFFADGLQAMLWACGLHLTRVSVDIILPLGISFYTFQAMTYVIDINRRVMKPTRDILDFALFISFFPLLVAGPIERARNLLPQIQNIRIVTRRHFNEGCWLIFWGLYKKIAVADNLAKITRAVFESNGYYSGSEALVAAFAFTIQVYADFSGYSDMARGLAKLMGFNLMLNFQTPFFSRNIYDLWQRWHISLTTWIKEYVFYPLALARFYGRQFSAPAVIMLTWAVMGFWHGSAWKFVLWGLYHGALVVAYSRVKPYISAVRIDNPFLKRCAFFAQISLVFTLFTVGILFFAVPYASDVPRVVKQIFFDFSNTFRFAPNVMGLLAILMLPLLLVEARQFRANDEMTVLGWPLAARALTYYFILYCIIFYGDFGAQKYYYFQF
jgi:D-alanyl-lipoteichoic acid acyltransferase DltB (MBOAT superfamily)